MHRVHGTPFVHRVLGRRVPPTRRRRSSSFTSNKLVKHNSISSNYLHPSLLITGSIHGSLQVRIGSGRACIKEEDIGKFIDTSEIHRYSINGNTVLYLNPNNAPVPDASHNLNCLTCRTTLVQDRIYNFCSIACKVSYRN